VPEQGCTHLITPSVHCIVRERRRQVQTAGRSGVIEVHAQPVKNGHQERLVVFRVIRHRLADFLTIEVNRIFIITTYHPSCLPNIGSSLGT